MGLMSLTKVAFSSSQTVLLLRRPNNIEFDPFEFRSSPVLYKILSTTYLISIVLWRLWQTGYNRFGGL